MEEFIKEFEKQKSCENTEIDFIVTSGEFNDKLIPYAKYELLDRDSFGSEVKGWGEGVVSFVGCWDGKEVYRGETVEEYDIQSTKLYEICSCCFNEKFYNKNKDDWYCPHCLEHRPWHYRLTQWKRKAISYLPSRLKQ